MDCVRSMFPLHHDSLPHDSNSWSSASTSTSEYADELMSQAQPRPVSHHDGAAQSSLECSLYKGKAKFKNSEPTIVSKEEFDLLNRALSLHRFNNCQCNSEKTICSECALVGASQLLSEDLGTVTSDFISWIDAPLSNSKLIRPPVLTFAAEKKGQPVTVVFYRNRASKSSSEGSLVASNECSSEPSRVVLKFSAGVCLVRQCHCENGRKRKEVLVIRRGDGVFYELPKGHLEKGESLAQAATRELREETGITNIIEIGRPLLSERYTTRKSETERLEKYVHYFIARLMGEEEDVVLGEREADTTEMRWLNLSELDKTVLKSAAVRSVITLALSEP